MHSPFLAIAPRAVLLRWIVWMSPRQILLASVSSRWGEPDWRLTKTITWTVLRIRWPGRHRKYDCRLQTEDHQHIISVVDYTKPRTVLDPRPQCWKTCRAPGWHMELFGATQVKVSGLVSIFRRNTCILHCGTAPEDPRKPWNLKLS